MPVQGKREKEMVMSQKCFRGAALFVALIFVASLTHAATDKEVIIGLNVPLSGPYVLQGNDQLNAYALAKVEVDKQGGILGRQIRYLIADSKSDPKVSVQNVQKFVDQGVDMVTGGSSSGVAVAVSKLCQEKKKLFLATLTYSNDTTGKDAHRHTFRECYSAWMAAKALGKYLKKSFPNKKYFYITADYTWGWTTRDSMKKFTGTESASDILIPLGEPLGSPRYKEAIQKALDEKTEVLVLVLFGTDMIAGLRAAIDMGAKDKMQIIVPNLEMHMTLGYNDHPISGVIGAMPWYWEVPYKYNFEAGKKFVEDYRTRYGKPPCTGGATAYTNIMLYKDAVERVKSFDPKLIIPALEGYTFTSLKDKETIRSWDHQTIQTVYTVRGRSASAMKDKWDVFDVLEASGGEELLPTFDENPVKLERLD
jgi:branched-chain amino acid transport system substrate-binding protein